MTRCGAEEGSISKDPKNGRWRALVDIGAGASGKRQRKKVSGRTQAKVLLSMPRCSETPRTSFMPGGGTAAALVPTPAGLRADDS